MKRNHLNIITGSLVLGSAMAFALASCNKALPEATPVTYPVATTSIGEYMASDTNFRLYRLASVKVGVFATLSDRTKAYTVYAPTNTAFRSIGLDSLQIVNATGSTLTTLGAIVNFHIIPGETWSSDAIPMTFPNVQLPTSLSLGSLPGTAIPFPLTTFLSRRSSGFWFNMVPGTGSPVGFTYGSLNSVTRIAIPTTAYVKNLIDADPSLSLYDSLILRADVGSTPSSSIAGILSNAGASITAFAPNNAAMKTFLSQASGGLIPPAAPDATFAAFIRTSFPVQSAQAIVYYHLLATPAGAGFVPQRVFSVNFNTTASFIKTLFNNAPGAAAHPGVSASAFFTGQVVDSIKVIGIGAGSVMATSKPAANFDRNCINGVVHVIDQVLRPQ